MCVRVLLLWWQDQYISRITDKGPWCTMRSKCKSSMCTAIQQRMAGRPVPRIVDMPRAFYKDDL